MASLFFVSLLFLLGLTPSFAVHNININSITPIRLSSLTWDPIERHFIVGSSEAPTLYVISDAGMVEHLLSDNSMNNTNDSVSSVAVDHVRHRLIVAFSISSFVAAYDLKSHQKICGIPLPQLEGAPGGVAVDAETGDVFVTSSTKGIVLKVLLDEYGFIVSEVKITGDQGLGGIVHVNNNQNPYILVVQPAIGKIFKVGTKNGIAAEVLPIGKSKILAPKGQTIALHDDLSLTIADNIRSLRFLENYRSWSRAIVHFEESLEDWEHVIAVTVRDGKKAYALINTSILYMIVEVPWWLYRRHEMGNHVCVLFVPLAAGMLLAFSLNKLSRCWRRRFVQEEN